MAIKFWNVKSREVAIAVTEPQISAMWGSSDRGPNAMVGQDMGWRLAPEVVVELKRIKSDQIVLERIAARLNRPIDEVGEQEILTYISAQTPLESAPVATEEDFSEEYVAEIRAVEAERQRIIAAQLEADRAAGRVKPAPVPEAPQESIEDLEKRVQLEERLAKARATAQAPAGAIADAPKPEDTKPAEGGNTPKPADNKPK